jgi:hypothetical protein
MGRTAPARRLSTSSIIEYATGVVWHSFLKINPVLVLKIRGLAPGNQPRLIDHDATR